MNYFAKLFFYCAFQAISIKLQLGCFDYKKKINKIKSLFKI